MATREPRPVAEIAATLVRELECFEAHWAKRPGMADHLATPGFVMSTAELRKLAEHVLSAPTTTV